MINKTKRLAEPFIRGPLTLSVLKKFRNLGFGPTLLYLHYSYKYQMQAQQKRTHNDWWPVENDCRYVRMTSIAPFWRRPQQKYEAIKKCKAANLIEVLPTSPHAAAIIRVLGEKEMSDGKEKTDN